MSATRKAQRYILEKITKTTCSPTRTPTSRRKTLFDITHKLILNQKHEIRRVSVIDWHFTPWMRSTLLHDKVIKLSKAKVHVYSDSVLRLGKMHRHLDAMVKWKGQLQYFQSSFEYRERIGIDRKPFEFEWNIFSRHTTVEILAEIQTRVAVRGIRPEEFEDRIIFISMSNDIDWN